MAPDLKIQQGLLTAHRQGVRVVGESEGFPTPEAERLVVLYGTPPEGMPCPQAHFAYPIGRDRVAVVTVADRPPPGTSERVLAFRFLVLSQGLYWHLGDPFAIAERYPAEWSARGALPELAWPEEGLPPRRVEDLDAILRTQDSGWLLGAAQALLDGFTLSLQRSAPAEDLVRSLWQLLPTRCRPTLWPATFAFSDELDFHLVVLPPGLTRERLGDLNEEQTRDYPPGRYELNLQIAVEGGDQAELDRLLARRTSQETLRLGLGLILVALIAAAVFRLIDGR